MNYSIYPKQFNNNHYKLQSDTCFVIMPFCNELNNTYMVIESAADSMNIKCTRADKVITTSEPILNKICTQISKSYFIIVDISNLNPNVFYELGVAHVLRDANKVLIIKEENTECPSDIKHIHYYSYKKSDLKGLKQIIINFFEENNILEDLESILAFRELLPSNTVDINEYVIQLSNYIGSYLDILIKILNNKTNDCNNDDVYALINQLFESISKIEKYEKLYNYYLELLLFVLLKIQHDINIYRYIVDILQGKYPNIPKTWISDLCISMLNNSMCFDTVFSWIVEQFKASNPASFDLVRYKLEIGIINSKNTTIDSHLIETLKSSNKTLAEHSANLIKERKVYNASSTLLHIIEHESSPYVVRSCIDALISVASLDQLRKAKKALSNRKEFILKNDFLEKHITDLDAKIMLSKQTF